MRRRVLRAGGRFTIFALACVLGLPACTPQRAVQAPPGTIVPFPGVTGGECLHEQVLPKILEISPAEIRPGSEVSVRTSGGYVKDTCGGIIEGSGLFKVFLDDQPIADLACDVNRCEGKFRLPENIAAGSHCLGVQKGTCQMELEVTASQ